MMKIKYIFLDLGGVLIINQAAKIGDKYKQQYGIDPQLFQKIFSFVQSHKRNNTELNRYLAEINITPNIWRNYQNDFYNSECRNDQLYQILKSVKPRVKIFFTTNNSDKLTPIIGKYQISHLADWTLNSSKAQVSKPDPRFWDIAYNKAHELTPDCNKKEILVVDDSQTNVQSAKDYGLSAFLFKSGLENSLDQLLITD